MDCRTKATPGPAGKNQPAAEPVTKNNVGSAGHLLHPVIFPAAGGVAFDRVGPSGMQLMFT